jgi:hypothetical protein
MVEIREYSRQFLTWEPGTPFPYSSRTIIDRIHDSMVICAGQSAVMDGRKNVIRYGECELVLSVPVQKLWTAGDLSLLQVAPYPMGTAGFRRLGGERHTSALLALRCKPEMIGAGPHRSHLDYPVQSHSGQSAPAIPGTREPTGTVISP